MKGGEVSQLKYQRKVDDQNERVIIPQVLSEDSRTRDSGIRVRTSAQHNGTHSTSSGSDS